MARLIWSPQSLDDIASICSYIARDSEHYARLFASEVFELAEEIAAYPRSGRVVPEYGRASLRERFYQEYRVVYKLTGGAVQIVAVVHGARLLPRAIRRRRLS